MKVVIYRFLKWNWSSWRFPGFWGGGQNLERRNVKRLIFQNFEITNIKMKKDELFDPFIFELLFIFFRNYLNTQNI